MQGSLPIGVGHLRELAVLLAATAAGPPTIVAEWTPHGVVPVAVHCGDRALDVGPRAEFTGRPLRE